MSPGFRLFGPVHVAILAAIPVTALALARVGRGHAERSRFIAGMLGVALAVNEITWYIWLLRTEGFHFPDTLPLELCDLTLWLTVTSALLYGTQAGAGVRPVLFEFAWLAGVGGSLMAVLTPDLGAAPVSYPVIYFFLAHGGLIATLLFLVWSGLARPRPGCVWRTFVLLNAYAALIGTFDAVFHANYMYLCRKPENASLLDFFGPWPFYLVGGEATALTIFWILWAPFRKSKADGGFAS